MTFSFCDDEWQDAPYHGNSDEEAEHPSGASTSGNSAHIGRRHGFVNAAAARNASPLPPNQFTAVGAGSNGSDAGGGGGGSYHHQHHFEHAQHAPTGSRSSSSPSPGAASHALLASLPPEQQFLLQLATTHRALYNVLAKNNAIPDQVAYLLPLFNPSLLFFTSLPLLRQ